MLKVTCCFGSLVSSVESVVGFCWTISACISSCFPGDASFGISKLSLPFSSIIPSILIRTSVVGSLAAGFSVFLASFASSSTSKISLCKFSLDCHCIMYLLKATIGDFEGSGDLEGSGEGGLM